MEPWEIYHPLFRSRHFSVSWYRGEHPYRLFQVFRDGKAGAFHLYRLIIVWDFSSRTLFD